MSEPLYESTEVNWRSYLDRFDTVIWPTLFRGRGIDKGSALIAWSLGLLQDDVSDIKKSLEHKEF